MAELELFVVSEAPTPHNNYLFAELARSPGVDLTLWYVYDERSVPERPWKSLEGRIAGAHVLSGLGSTVSPRLLWAALRAPADRRFLVIGWNHPVFWSLILTLGVLRRPFAMWCDTPTPAAEAGHGWKGFAKRLLIWLLARGGGVLFVTGKTAARAYQSLGMPSERIVTLPFFVPGRGPEERAAARARIRKKHGIAEGVVLILAAGRLIKSKGFDLLLDAAVKLPPQADWRIVIVGSGPEGDDLKTRGRERTPAGRLEFVAWLEPGELLDYFDAADVFVAPARFDPFPTTILSAMGGGKVVVATDQVFSAVEFIRQGENGYLLPPNDADALANVLDGVISLGAEGRAAVGRAAQKTMADWPVTRGVSIIRQNLEAPRAASA